MAIKYGHNGVYVQLIIRFRKIWIKINCYFNLIKLKKRKSIDSYVDEVEKMILIMKKIQTSLTLFVWMK